jgi:hypothetical protein
MGHSGGQITPRQGHFEVSGQWVSLFLFQAADKLILDFGCATR